MRLGCAIPLESLPAGLAAYQPALDPRPLLLDRGWVENLLHLQQLLLTALQGLLAQEETADFLELTGVARDQIRWANQFPLRLGCLRPDFVIDIHGNPFLCEINARFPVNGFLASAYLSDQFGVALPHYTPTCSGDQIRDALKLPVGSLIVKGREPGWDIHQLSLEQNAPIVRAMPARASLLVLELHQDELVQPTGCQPYFNDLRTQWLGHDKRLLQLLGQPHRLEPWLGPAAQRLSEFILPTRSLRDGRDFSQFSVLKPNRSGKGEGLVFGHDLRPEEWQQRLASAPAEWVVQTYMESLTLGTDRLVGTLLSRDRQSLGLGIFRASPHRVVNVSGGGRVLFPMIHDA